MPALKLIESTEDRSCPANGFGKRKKMISWIIALGNPRNPRKKGRFNDGCVCCDGLAHPCRDRICRVHDHAHYGECGPWREAVVVVVVEPVSKNKDQEILCPRNHHSPPWQCHPVDLWAHCPSDMFEREQ